jgi:beta-xylosidase
VVSDTILGPYTSAETTIAYPLDKGGAIDPSGFTDTDGKKHYVMYKVDGNSLGDGGMCGNNDHSHSTPLMLQPLKDDGISPIGDPV